MRNILILALGTIALASCGMETASTASPLHAKNVILFVGDGMGVSTVTAARIFDGQDKGMDGEENWLPFERFPSVALVKTYNTNQQVPDSAGTITAMLTGVKTRAGVINIGPESRRRNCEEELANPLTPISRLAKEHGKAAGFVTTTRITHATPAAVYARTSERDWEDDRYIDPSDWQRGCKDIAWQLLNDPDGGIDVAMGGGRRQFFGSDAAGERVSADADLVGDWLAAAEYRRYLTTVDELATLQAGEQVLGLFSGSHMTYTAEKPDDSTEPALADLATTAVRLLSANENGYFLLVEGGRIDHGHHDGKPGFALVEAQQFAQAVAAVLEIVDLKETLVLVTADHSHTFTVGGYPTRGNPILGLVVKNDEHGEPRESPDIADDGQPYTTLSYANGPGALRELPRPAPEVGVTVVNQSLVPLRNPRIDGTFDDGETHGGEDVALYAIGPGSDAVHGVIEQNRIFDYMMSAYGWERDIDR